MFHGKISADPNLVGGLDIRKLSAMNMAMLGKLGWNLVVEKKNIMGENMKAKYFSTTSFMKCRKK